MQKKADIISKLQREILTQQGFKPISADELYIPRLGIIDRSFPNNTFPIATVHEFIQSAVDPAPTLGFISYLLASLMGRQRISVWLSTKRSIFPPALTTYALDAGHFLFIQLRNQRELIWATEEAMKCNGIAAVVSENKDLDFTTSRRLQLAAEQSRATCFIIRKTSKNINANACTARWQISSLPSFSDEAMPGVGMPSWNVELLKIRNGKPGRWTTLMNKGVLKVQQSSITSIENIEIGKAV